MHYFVRSLDKKQTSITGGGLGDYGWRHLYIWFCFQNQHQILYILKVFLSPITPHPITTNAIHGIFAFCKRTLLIIFWRWIWQNKRGSFRQYAIAYTLLTTGERVNYAELTFHCRSPVKKITSRKRTHCSATLGRSTPRLLTRGECIPSM